MRRHDRPDWWPAGEAWPPRGRHRSPRRLVRRFTFALATLLLAIGGLIAAGVWALIAATGVITVSWPVRGVAIAVLALGALGLLLLVRLARRVAAPAGALVAATARIAQGDYTARVPVRGPRELRALAHAFNGMSERLEVLDRERRSFLADVAHELRTPLAVIRGRTEAILDGIHPPVAQNLEPVLDQTLALERLIDDLTTLSLAETGSLTLSREPVDLHALLEDTAVDFADAARERGVALTVEPGAEVPGAEVDPVRIRQALANLITNALRNTPAGGGITLGLGTVNGVVEIEVRDTGRGIPADLLPTVFERFSKGPGSTGTGLGLAIVRDLVAAHGGSVRAESAPGAGTTVTITLPTG